MCSFSKAGISPHLDSGHFRLRLYGRNRLENQHSLELIHMQIRCCWLILLTLSLNLSAASERRFYLDSAVAPMRLGAQPGEFATVTRQVLTAPELAMTQSVGFALKLRNVDELNARIARNEVLTIDELSERYFPLLEDWLKVAHWARAQGLKVEAEDPTRLTVAATGTIARVQTALQMRFARVIGTDELEHTSAISSPALPEEFRETILSVLNLQPHLQPLPAQTPVVSQIEGNYLLPQTFASLYKATGLGLDGAGQTIVILGSNHVNPDDLTAFWQNCGLPTTLAQFSEIILSSNVALGDNSRAFEETMDIQWASAMAPRAEIVYLTTIGMDVATPWIISQLATGRRIHQLSVSFGLMESVYTVPPSVRAARSQYYTTLAAAGVTIFVASGDWGSTQRVNNGVGVLSYDASGVTSPWYPASEPHVTGVGGTTVMFSRQNFIFAAPPVTEGAWSLRNTPPQAGTASGGGVSLYFSRPTWQTGPGLPPGNMRCVPDVAALASSNFYPYMYFRGRPATAGATSLSSPLWAGLCALINQARAEEGLPALGLLGPRIYPLMGTAAFNQMTTGAGDGSDTFSNTATNGAYMVGPNYNMLTGLGSPNMEYLIAALTVPESPVTPAPTPTLPPTPTQPAPVTPSPSGGGAPSEWFFASLCLLVLARKLTKEQYHVPPGA